MKLKFSCLNLLNADITVFFSFPSQYTIFKNTSLAVNCVEYFHINFSVSELHFPSGDPLAMLPECKDKSHCCLCRNETLWRLGYILEVWLPGNTLVTLLLLWLLASSSPWGKSLLWWTSSSAFSFATHASRVITFPSPGFYFLPTRPLEVSFAASPIERKDA